MMNQEYGAIPLEPGRQRSTKAKEDKPYRLPILISSLLSVILLCTLYIGSGMRNVVEIETTGSDSSVGAAVMGAAWSSIQLPFSTVNPRTLALPGINRVGDSDQPGPIFDNMIKGKYPLPTNSWCENLLLGESNRDVSNRVFQVPYIVDTAGDILGVRTHPATVEASDLSVLMGFEDSNGLTLGAVERMSKTHRVDPTGNAVGRLSVILEWSSSDSGKKHVHKRDGAAGGSVMRSHIVRGSPYSSMHYVNATPRIYAQRHLPLTDSRILKAGSRSKARYPVLIDNDPSIQLLCGEGVGNFSSTPVLVEKEISLQFMDTSDMTWLIFVSEPTMFICSNYEPEGSSEPLPPGQLPTESNDDENAKEHFELRAVSPMKHGMVRLAMGNNCTYGLNPINCGAAYTGIPRNNDVYLELLRNHSDVFPTGYADIAMTYPVESTEEEKVQVHFQWAAGNMQALRHQDPATHTHTQAHADVNGTLLILALPHQQNSMLSSGISDIGGSQVLPNIPNACLPTLHGSACPVLGNEWIMTEHLHAVSFLSKTPVRPSMLQDIRTALKKDIHFFLPGHYMRGEGDMYFAGKMLAKLARIVLIADNVTDSVTPKEMRDALGRLKDGLEIWLNGSAAALLLYDQSWGGIVSCGCTFDKRNHRCENSFPDCPGLVDMGNNFGAGFYNDHHFHFGYFIYAAAVVAQFDRAWLYKYHESVLLFVRDIANPSQDDPYFPTWRHKDWYLGSSWASGIVTLAGQPNLNGRNQESSAEAIHAYEAIALYGRAASDAFKHALSAPLEKSTQKSIDHHVKDSDNPADTHGNSSLYLVHIRNIIDSCERVYETGRLLLSTEIRSAQTYWHVQANQSDSLDITLPRIYPRVYSPKVVGMLWSMLAQQQTWFGNEPWKSYGIQVITLTTISEDRDSPAWISEMLPLFDAACNADPVCESDGWSILVATSKATIGYWRDAWKEVNALASSVFVSAGGNGQSRTNTLYYIGTRPRVHKHNRNHSVQ